MHDIWSQGLFPWLPLIVCFYIRFISRQQLNDQPYLIRWLMIKNESMICFDLLPAFMNFYCHLVFMATNAFYSEINFLLYMGKKLFNTEKNKNGIKSNFVIIKLS